MTTLPTIAERPDSNIIIFDGQCRFCTGSVSWLHRCDWRQQLSFVSLHEPIVSARWPELTYEQLMEQMYVVDRAGQAHGGARAFRYLTRILPPLWVLAPIAHLPFATTIGQRVYRAIAKQRYRFGKVECEDTCEVHFR